MYSFATKPYRPSWTDKDMLVFASAACVIALSAVLLMYMFWSVYNIEQSNSRNRWKNRAEIYKMQYDKALDKITVLERTCLRAYPSSSQ